MPKKNIAPGTNHIKVPLPKGEPKKLVLLPIRSEDYDWLEDMADDYSIEIHEAISRLIMEHLDE